MDSSKFQYEGMKWLLELELLNHPQAINTIKFNILMTSNRIKEVEILTMRENKTMLVLLDLTWIGRKFFKKRIFSEVEEILTQLLPSFRFRVIDDPEIMKLAIERVKQALTGGKNENALNPSNVPDPNSNQQPVVSETAAPTEAQQGAVEGSIPSGEEQPQTGQEVPTGTGTNDPEEK